MKKEEEKEEELYKLVFPSRNWEGVIEGGRERKKILKIVKIPERRKKKQEYMRREKGECINASIPIQAIILIKEREKENLIDLLKCQWSDNKRRNP